MKPICNLEKIRASKSLQLLAGSLPVVLIAAALLGAAALGLASSQAAFSASPAAPLTQCTPTARTTAQLNLREGPGTNYAIILTMPRRALVPVTGSNVAETWYQVVYQGIQGWSDARYLRVDCAQNVPVVAYVPAAPPPTSPPPPTATPAPQTPGVSFTAGANSVNIGNCTIVYWTVSNVDQVWLGTGSLQVNAPASGSQQVCPTMSTTYYMRTVKNNASTLHPVEVSVINPQNPANFRSNAYVLNPGLCATLSWNIDNVNGVFLFINGGFQGVAGNATRQVCVSTPTQYGLKVVYNTGQEVITPLTINITNQPPGNVQFTANPTTINQGECTTLSWIVGNASSVVLIDPSSNSTSQIGGAGQIEVCPQTSVQYTIQAQVSGGQTVQASQAVTVIPAGPTPVPVPTAQP